MPLRRGRHTEKRQMITTESSSLFSLPYRQAHEAVVHDGVSDILEPTNMSQLTVEGLEMHGRRPRLRPQMVHNSEKDDHGMKVNYNSTSENWTQPAGLYGTLEESKQALRQENNNLEDSVIEMLKFDDR